MAQGGLEDPFTISQQICLQQGMQADPGALAALCEKTHNDIRACVNTLQVGRGLGRGQGRLGQSWLTTPPLRVQFLHGQGQRELSVQAVQTTRIGLKDQRKGLFSVWQEVFQLPQAQR